MTQKTVICRLDLGRTRIAGYVLFDDKTDEFQELTPKEVKVLIAEGRVNGLKLVGGEIKLDAEGFNQQNLMIKSAVGKFRSLYPSSNVLNSMYAVVRYIICNKGQFYELISNKAARIIVTPERLRVLMEVTFVAGVRLVGGEILLCKGVQIEDKAPGSTLCWIGINVVEDEVDRAKGGSDNLQVDEHDVPVEQDEEALPLSGEDCPIDEPSGETFSEKELSEDKTLEEGFSDDSYSQEENTEVKGKNDKKKKGSSKKAKDK